MLAFARFYLGLSKPSNNRVGRFNLTWRSQDSVRLDVSSEQNLGVVILRTRDQTVGAVQKMLYNSEWKTRNIEDNKFCPLGIICIAPRHSTFLKYRFWENGNIWKCSKIKGSQNAKSQISKLGEEKVRFWEKFSFLGTFLGKFLESSEWSKESYISKIIFGGKHVQEKLQRQVL